MPMAAQVPCSFRALPAKLGEENSLASSFHLLHLLICVTAQSQVTQLGSQADSGTAWACQASIPHLDFPAQGQWKPVSHLKEVLSPKQEVALQTKTPRQDLPRALGQVAWVAEFEEGREADWYIAALIQILLETQTQYPSSAL